MMKESPNLFSYATKELSQDAVICWLIKWSAGGSAPDLVQLGREFVECLLNHKREGKVKLGTGALRVEIHQQDNGIDVLARINNTHVLLIEDKTGSNPHSGQLERYRKAVLSDQTNLKGVSENDLFAIYFKTGNQSRESVRVIEKESGYRVFDRADFLNVLSLYAGNNAILSDFKEHLVLIERQTQSFHQWRQSGREGDRHWYAWEGLYHELEARLFDADSDHPWRNWGYVSNPSGGFLGFWWLPPELPEEHPAYLQLEQEKLCFKAYAGDSSPEQQERLKRIWSERITRQHESVVPPKRMRRGVTMTVAIHKEGWLRYNDEGLLSLDATVESLREAERLLLAAAKTS